MYHCIIPWFSRNVTSTALEATWDGKELISVWIGTSGNTSFTPEISAKHSPEVSAKHRYKSLHCFHLRLYTPWYSVVSKRYSIQNQCCSNKWKMCIVGNLDRIHVKWLYIYWCVWQLQSIYKAHFVIHLIICYLPLYIHFFHRRTCKLIYAITFTNVLYLCSWGL